MNESQIVICWFRRDLRFQDHKALHMALKSGYKVLPVFIFDKQILQHLPLQDKRVNLIHDALQAMHRQLQALGGSMLTFHGTSMEAWQYFTRKFAIAAVYTHHDYEPFAMERDVQISDFFKSKNIEFYTFKDQCIFEKNEIIKDNGAPYTVYTPYKNKWMSVLNESHYQRYEIQLSTENLVSIEQDFPAIESMGFEKQNVDFPEVKLSQLQNYEQIRDFPAIEGTTKVSVALRFGLLSIRQLVRLALEQNAQKWLNELIWRDFYMMILWHFPHTVHQSFKSSYDRIAWRNNEQEFKLWCEGKTGYPLVDAGMRQLNETGWMHNRVRMLVASFLCKHLLIDWRWGEAYFAQKLLDYEQASNIGGWQWACGSGNDAVPYFRIFSPMLQHKKFDPQSKYINYWVPEWQNLNYRPMVDHNMARKRCLEVYKKAINL